MRCGKLWRSMHCHPTCKSAFDRAESSLKQSLGSIQQSLERLDKTLVEAAANAGSKMQHQLEQLRSRAARAELRQSEILGRHAELLGNALYPNKVLQEREIGGVYFVARHGPELLRDLYDTLRTDCLDHQIISLSSSGAEQIIRESNDPSRSRRTLLPGGRRRVRICRGSRVEIHTRTTRFEF